MILFIFVTFSLPFGYLLVNPEVLGNRGNLRAPGVHQRLRDRRAGDRWRELRPEPGLERSDLLRIVDQRLAMRPQPDPSGPARPAAACPEEART